MSSDYYTVVGEYFGYPQCCIKAFKERVPAMFRPDVVQRAIFGGFVPCEACAKRVVAGEITIHQLIKDRKCKTKFPKEPSDRVFENYLKKHYEPA